MKRTLLAASSAACLMLSGAAFAAAAFELEPDAFDRVSAPIAGQDAPGS